MLLFFYGADSFRSQEKIQQLKEKFLAKDSSGSGLSVLDFGEKVPLATLQDAISTGGLFSEKRFVIARDAIGATSSEMQKEIVALLKNHKGLADDANIVVLFWENTDPKKNGSLFKYLFKNAKKQEFAPFSNAEISKWIGKKIAEINPAVTIDLKTSEMLATYVGNDLNALDNELSKLVSYSKNGKITAQDIELLIKAKLDSTIFETIEALTSGNKKKALELFHGQLTNGEDAYYILSMYVYQVRNLLKIAECVENGNTNHFNIAKEAKLHPFVVQKSLPHIRALSLEKIKSMLLALADIDFAAKTGKTDLVLALDTFIVSL